ncbi:MAG: transporter substrate-binding domain-containing protein [Proteobacteria bacterium]|nr:transporter substrate-binding domain-containing protein [Pseudomonadota bacterium]
MAQTQCVVKAGITSLPTILRTFIVLLWCLASPPAAYADHLAEGPTHLQSASELDYPPFAIVKPDGTADGFSVELLQAAVEAAGKTISFKIGPWHELKEELATGILDVLPLVSYSKERHKIYDFTAPYLRMNGTVFVRKNTTDIKSIADLKGKEVLVMKGDTAHEYVVQENLTDKIFPTVSYDEAFQRLAQGQHDAVVVQQLVGLQMLKKLHIDNVVAVASKGIGTLKPVALRLDGFEQNFCFAVKEGNHELLSQLNEGLAVLYLNGTYEALYKKWFWPILPPLEHSLWQIIKELLFILVPLLLILSLLVMWYLKRLVSQKTMHLEEEIKRRKRIEISLEEANANYIKAQAIGRVGNWTYDIATNTFLGSAETRRIFGFDSHSSSLSLEAVEACIRERDRVHQALIDLIEKGTSYNLEFEIITQNTAQVRAVKARAELSYNSLGKPQVVNGILQDITEQKLVAEALQESERFLREVGAIARIGGWEHDLIARTARWTEETFKIVEMEAGPVPGPDEHLSYYPAEDRAILEKEYRQAMKTGKKFDLELQGNTSKGRLIWVRVIGHPVFNDGKCVKMRGTFQDITDKKRMLENMLQSQRLESIGVLAGGISHDFNNILSAILGFTELALENESANSQLRDDLQEIYAAGRRAKELVQQILTFSREKYQTPCPLSVPVIVNDAVRLLRATFPATISMVIDAEENVRPVLADPIQLQQAIMNICTNACQAMEGKGGALTIKVQETVASESLLEEQPHLSPGAYIALKIQDTGIGIMAERLGLIFDPYFTTKHLGDGTGLGLAVTYGIVREMRGAIIVESEPGQGSIFTVFLPVVDQELREIPSADPETPCLPGGTERILIVDDELPILKLTSRVLEEHGYTVTTAENGVVALEKFKNDPQAYDLVISDVSMPTLSGDQLAKAMLTIRPDLPILLASGYSKTVTEETALQDGVKGLLQKPVSEESLLRAVRQVLP